MTPPEKPLAKMRFLRLRDPAERGVLLLHEDGTVQIRPSEALRDEMARLEEAALDRARTYGTRLGGGLMLAGALALGAGWLAGRVFGKLGFILSKRRPVSEVSLTRQPGGGVRLSLPGANRWQRIQMAWNPDEVLDTEADNFVAKFTEMKLGMKSDAAWGADRAN